MKKIILLSIIFSTSFMIFGSVSAQQAPLDQSEFSYYLHLYFDNGTITPNRDAKLKYEVVLDKYVPEKVTSSNTYVGEILSLPGVLINKFNFDPAKGNTSFKKGVLELKAPYYDNAKLINLYDGQHKLLLSIDVSGTLTCNENNVCEDKLGENVTNCSADCRIATSTPVPTPTPSDSVAPVPVPTGSGTDWMMIILIALSVIAVAGLAAWFIIKDRRKKANSISITLPE